MECDKNIELDKIRENLDSLEQRLILFENWTIKKLAESEWKRQLYESVKETWQCGNCNAVMHATKQFQHVCSHRVVT